MTEVSSGAASGVDAITTGGPSLARPGPPERLDPPARSLAHAGTSAWGPRRAGTLSESEAAQLADLLQLSALSGTTFQDDADCVDPSAWLLTTRDADVSCGCDCDDSLPRAVRAAVGGNEAAFALAERADGAPPSGPVEVVVVHDASTSSAVVT
jgi:hypothetical protein